ncbi:hypothetical protein HRI_001759400 [Hibiscus trionum]|uniref:Endonuclease/exonuclease/phosphatase domain-containing protein n=1 Tax=Hibiscus trionum TaxID=183268 RepID=A0A9W7LYH8_HIBTR|nr:hypothetical protein HRI_001759400 [Hibiscus trionum]
MEAFRDALKRNSLCDIKPTHGWFTWHKGDDVDTYIKQRIDRFVASIPWLHYFSQCEITTEYAKDSDHCFLLLNTEGKQRKESKHEDYFKHEELKTLLDKEEI